MFIGVHVIGGAELPGFGNNLLPARGPLDSQAARAHVAVSARLAALRLRKEAAPPTRGAGKGWLAGIRESEVRGVWKGNAPVLFQKSGTGFRRL